jgi:hypothetical protein
MFEADCELIDHHSGFSLHSAYPFGFSAQDMFDSAMASVFVTEFAEICLEEQCVDFVA